jgi:hypothetical protein
MKYELSNRQKKELVERGQEMTLAIPLPSWIESDADMMEHLREMLPINHEWIKSAYITTLDVRLTGARGSGLTGIIGEIVHEQTDEEEHIIVEMSVALVDLCAVTRPRGRVKTQWPASVTVHGKRLPQ